MEINVPNKIFDRENDNFQVGLSTIYLYLEDEIDSAQKGYRYNSITNEKIEDWFGDEYVVIGNDSCCGDPIIAKIDEENIPIYYMFHDDWSTIEKIANSFEEFMYILNQIDDANLDDRDDCKMLIEKINKEIKLESYDYWESLIISSFEFFTDESFNE